jgi:hypothetical protein
MSATSGKVLFWAPRVLSILFIAFLSMFALDVFDEHLGFWRTTSALTMHLLPSIVLIAALIVAWRREWVGSMLYAAAGLLYVIWAVSVSRPVPLSVRYIWMLTIAGPAFVIAVLFLLNWRKHDELRTFLR